MCAGRASCGARKRSTSAVIRRVDLLSVGLGWIDKSKFLVGYAHLKKKLFRGAYETTFKCRDPKTEGS
ncbi:unnamed protein product [Urochloa humidicola]